MDTKNIFSRFFDNLVRLMRPILLAVVWITFTAVILQGTTYFKDMGYVIGYLNKNWQQSLRQRCTELPGCLGVQYEARYLETAHPSKYSMPFGAHMKIHVRLAQTASTVTEQQIKTELNAVLDHVVLDIVRFGTSKK